MNYIFHIRNWNVDFFLELENTIIKKDPLATFTRLTMLKSVVKNYENHDKKIYYLPNLLENQVDESETTIQFVDEFDKYLNKKYNFGLPFLFEIERFKNVILSSSSSINYVKVLNQFFTEGSILVSLSCDHYIYILSSYINEFYNGKSFFIQPIGFPLNANVIMENPWKLSRFRESGLSMTFLQEYIDSLSSKPSESIHYMKSQKNINLLDSFKLKISQMILNRDKNVHGYLNPESKISIPSRFKPMFKKNYTPEGINLETIKGFNDKINLFYFPLQFEPEMSILAYSPFFKEQIEIVRLLSQSLKINDILLLKENPKMIGSRTRDFYYKIAEFENVVWADPNLNSRTIIKNCRKVISVTGTACIEAASMGVNSLLFGYPPFKNLLVDEPVSNQRLKDLHTILYINHTNEEIKAHLIKNWCDYSKSVFYGNCIPQYVGSKFTMNNCNALANDFFETVLKNNYATEPIS